MSDNNEEVKIPSELRLTYKWDGCVERALVNTTIGTVAGGLASVVLFRKSLCFSYLLYIYTLCFTLLFIFKIYIKNKNVTGGTAMRFALTAFGAGFGAGDAWSKCASEFEKEKK